MEGRIRCGTEPTRHQRCQMSAVGGAAESICSLRAFPFTTPLRTCRAQKCGLTKLNQREGRAPNLAVWIAQSLNHMVLSCDPTAIALTVTASRRRFSARTALYSWPGPKRHARRSGSPLIYRRRFAPMTPPTRIAINVRLPFAADSTRCSLCDGSNISRSIPR